MPLPELLIQLSISPDCEAGAEELLCAVSTCDPADGCHDDEVAAGGYDDGEAAGER